VNGISGFVLSLLLTLLNQFNLSLEAAFLQNDPAKLHQLMPADSPILMTLPEPFQVSDFFSEEQAFLIVKRLFQRTSTLEFFIDQEIPPVIEAKGAIVQARWSLVDSRDGRKYLFRVYFYLFSEKIPPDVYKANLRIREIRAEKR
jgi:hypothetical protein